MPSDRRIVARNAVVGWIALFTRVAVTFVLFPLLLMRLGGEVFGVWLIFGDLIGHAGILRLGLSSGLLREVAQLEAAGQRARLVHLLGTVLSIYLVLGLLLGALLVFLAPPIAALFGPPAEVLGEVNAALRIIALRMFLTFPASITGAALLGLRRYDLEYLIQTFGGLARLALVWSLVAGPGGIVTLAWIMVGVDLLENAVRRGVLFFIEPGLRIWPGRISRRLLGSIGSFSLDSFILNVAVRIQYELDSLVVGLIAGLHMVPVYEAAVKLVLAGRQFVDRLTDSVAPTIASLIGRGEASGLGASLLRWSTFLVLFATPLGLGMILVGPAFLRLYVGEQFSDGQLEHACAVLVILALVFHCRLFGTIPVTFLWGMARMRRASRGALLEALANLCLSVALCYPLGIVGVALGTLLPKLVTNLWLVPAWAARAVGVDGRALLAVARAPLVPVLVGSLCALPALLLLSGDVWRFTLGGSAMLAGYLLALRLGPHAELMRLRRGDSPSTP